VPKETPATPLLKVRGLTKAYREGARTHTVLEGLDLNIAAGQYVALLGRSGSGKSTLLNLLGGIDRPDAGEVRILGQAFSALPERGRTLFRRRSIGFVYQFFNLIPTLSALENVALPLELNGLPEAETCRRAGDMLGRMGLSERRHAFPDQLSGGEQQRVAIARALVHRPALLLADEPTGNLDAQTGEQVLDLLGELFGEGEHALLVVTHSLAVARRADRVLTLVDGRLAEHPGSLAW
jgi:putative ABC transport system ATP-binding protein